MNSFDSSGGPLDGVNAEYFAVLEGGRTVFCREEPDGSLAYMDKAAFLFEHAASSVTVGMRKDGSEAKETIGNAWIKWSGRRYFKRGFTLAPGGCGPDEYNMWRGFGVEPVAGDWSMMKRHIAEIICNGDAGLAGYVTKWCAWKVQNPLGRPLVALVLRGEEGTGKGFFCEALAAIFGKHATRVNQAEQVVGRFNAAIRGALLVWCDEIYWSDNDAHVGRLKNQITEPQISIERKGIDPVVEQNHAAFLFSTNADWSMPVGKDARRFVACDVSERQMQRRLYFDALDKERKAGGHEAMLHDLLAMDLGNFHPDRDRYETAALRSQKAETLRRQDTFARHWLEMLEGGLLPTGTPLKGGYVGVGTGKLLDYLRQERRVAAFGPKAIGDAFQKMGFMKWRPPADGRGWTVPPLSEARALFDAWQFAVAWDDEKMWEIAGRRNEPVVREVSDGSAQEGSPF